MSVEKMSVLVRLGKIPSKWLYLVIVLVVAIPIIYPFGTPFAITDATLAVYNEVEKLPAGGVVVIAGSNAYGFLIEIKECLQAFLMHVYSKDVKIVFISFSADDAMFTRVARDFLGISQDKPYKGKVYGIDWVDLGYITGGSASLAYFCKNAFFVTVDAYGNPTQNLPVMKEIGKADTWALYVEASAGTMVVTSMGVVSIPYKTTTVILNTAGWYPTHLPYVTAGIAKGMTMGILGGAEYEKLMGFVGLGHSGADVLNFTHLLTLVLVALANISYLGQYIEKRKLKEVKE